MAIDKIHKHIDTSQKPTEWNNYFPWHLLLLIRWIFQYTEPNIKLKNIKEKELIDLLNDIMYLSDTIYLEGQSEEEDAANAFIRRKMFLQLPYQIRPYELYSSVGRQMILFSDMGHKYKLDKIFHSYTGLVIREFLEIYFCCWAACNNGDSQKISIEYFNNIFPENSISSFFEVVSLDLESGKKYIRDYTSPKSRIDYQINEHTPLERKPFFNVGGNHVPYSIKLLESGLMNNIYDIFKENNPNSSGDFFGKIFEDYVSRGIEYAVGSDFIREKELQKLLPRGVKAPDFLIYDENVVILVDAKSTELHPIPRVLQSRDSLLKNLESTILHGVLQVITAAHHLVNREKINKDQKVLGILVTYREYIIGDGADFWNNIIGEYIQQKLTENNLCNHIQPGDFFYVSVDDFDWLVTGAKEQKTSIGGILERIAQRNRKPETKRLFLKQHLVDIWKKHHRPDYVEESFDRCFDEIKNRFGY